MQTKQGRKLCREQGIRPTNVRITGPTKAFGAEWSYLTLLQSSRLSYALWYARVLIALSHVVSIINVTIYSTNIHNRYINTSIEAYYLRFLVFVNY